MTDTATAQATESASQATATPAPVSASPTTAAPATPAVPIAQAASASQEGADKIAREVERLQRLLKEQQDKSKELEAQAQEVAAMRSAMRASNVEAAIRDAGVARPDLMARLFESKPEFYGADQKLNNDGRKALEAFVSGLGDELRSRKQASTPAPANNAPAPAAEQQAAEPKSGTAFMRKLWQKQALQGGTNGNAK